MDDDRPAPAANPAPCVLVVEDAFLLADEIARMVVQEGWRVMGPAPDLRQALTLMDGQLPDVALLDIDLAGEKVYALADELRRRHIPFVFVSGYDKAAIPPEYANVPLLEKPVVRWQLARWLGATHVAAHAASPAKK